MIQTTLFAGWFQGIAGMLMFCGSLFLILLVLVQRGRGGGLSGAFGGMGGQSAFGAKAGDTFTKITVITAAIWILLCMAAVRFTGNETTSILDDDPATAVQMDTDLDGDDAGSLDLGTSNSILDEAAAAATGEGDSAGESILDSTAESISDSVPPTEGASDAVDAVKEKAADAVETVKEAAKEAVESATDGK